MNYDGKVKFGNVLYSLEMCQKHKNFTKDKVEERVCTDTLKINSLGFVCYANR